PTPVPYGELYTALQSGVVDGAENNAPSFHTSRHYEICKYYSLSEHTGVPDVLLMSTHQWQALTEQEQEWLQEAAAESAVYQRKGMDEAVDQAMESTKENAAEISHAEKGAFIKGVQPLYQSHKHLHPQLYKCVGRIKQVNQTIALCERQWIIS